MGANGVFRLAAIAKLRTELFDMSIHCSLKGAVGLFPYLIHQLPTGKYATRISKKQPH